MSHATEVVIPPVEASTQLSVLNPEQIAEQAIRHARAQELGEGSAAHTVAVIRGIGNLSLCPEVKLAALSEASLRGASLTERNIERLRKLHETMPAGKVVHPLMPQITLSIRARLEAVRKTRRQDKMVLENAILRREFPANQLIAIYNQQNLVLQD